MSWGLVNHQEEKFDICEIEKLIYYHQFLPKDLDCFWEGFVNNRGNCRKKYNLTTVEKSQMSKILLCDPANWHLANLKEPILNGPDTGKCGPTYANAACAVKNYTRAGVSVFTPCCRNSRCQSSPG